MSTKSIAFELQPILEGKLLLLRPLRADDFEDLYAVASDPLIWEQHPAKERAEREGFRKFFQKALDTGGALVAIDRKDGRVIGTSRYHDLDERNSEIEIGYTFLARSHWGNGYNREMKQLMLRHAFRFVERVVFTVDPKNLRSQKAVEKVGGVRMGTRVNCEGRDSVLFQITASEFAERFRAAKG
ncbi:MAG TPA: GNAT family N-acetyltransferase [Bryocella sp.]|nr:GNAT family N-acetyltransferase [Bryocella sp.]